MLTNYLKVALKVLGRRKFFTFISLFGISLTLVVLMVAAAILDNVFAPRQPESRFDRVLGLYVFGMYGPNGGITSSPGYKFLDRYVRGLPSAEKTSLFTSQSPIVMYHDGRKVETHLRRTDGAYWQILDLQFLEGGPFTEQDNQNASFVAVITDDMRRKLYGDVPAVGKTLDVDGQRFRVVGVVPPVSITRLAAFSEIWAPVRTLKSSDYERQMFGNFAAIVQARSRADFPKLRSEFEQRMAHFVFDDPKTYNRVEAGLDTPFELAARSMVGNDAKVDRATTLRLIILLAALLFVTLPTMNLISINLSRIMERASEIGVRKAFGASSRALIGQFVMENVLLTIVGGAIGFVLSLVALDALTRIEIIPYAIFEVNLRIFAYGMLIAALFGIISGVYPAWRMSRMNPVNALRGGAA
ncbi:MAG TPA: ABC transporter permease [Thermoanaerobaculia bacterium]|nr:ABC transporter permease [Thermoanaerobaculia bacterium]